MEKTNDFIQRNPNMQMTINYWTTVGEYILTCHFGDAEDRENQLIKETQANHDILNTEFKQLLDYEIIVLVVFCIPLFMVIANLRHRCSKSY